MAQQVLGVHDARDVVDAVFIDRNARVAALDDAVEQFANRRRSWRRDDVDARHHHLAHGLLTQLDHAGDHFSLVFLEVGVALHQVAQSLFGVRRCGAALDTQQAPQGALEHVERHQDDEQQPVQHLDRAHKRERHMLGVCDREHAAEELRQQQYQDPDNAQRDGQPRRAGPHRRSTIQKPLAAAAHSASV